MKKMLMFLLMVCMVAPLVSAKEIVYVCEGQDADGDGVLNAQQFADILTDAGYTVTIHTDWTDLTQAMVDEMNAADLVIVGRDTDSGSYIGTSTEGLDEPTEWNGVTTPMLQTSAWLTRSSRWKWFDTTDVGSGSPALSVSDSTAAAYTGMGVNNGDVLNILADNVVINANPVTDLGSGILIGATETDSYPYIVRFDAGVEFYTGAGQTPAGTRVFFPAGTWGGSGNASHDGQWPFNDTGKTIFLNIVADLAPLTTLAHNPSPANGASNVQTNAALSWNTALDEGTGLPRADVVNHLVYLSAPNDPNLTTVTAVTVTADDSGLASYAPTGGLSRDAAYTWRVDEELTGGTILQGPKWSFEAVPSTPVVTTQPVVDMLIDAGTAVDLTVEALNPFTSNSTGMTYQWSHDGSPVGTGATLSIPSAQIADEGEYYCIVTITSNGATVQSDSGWVNVKRTVQWHSFDGDLTDTVGVNDGVYTNVDPNFVTPTFDTGFAGQAILLNGQEYINIGTAGYPRAHSSLEHASIACWIKTAADGKIMGNFNDQPQNSTTGFEFHVTGDNLRCYLRDEDATSIERKSGTGVNDDAWHFVVVAWDASPTGAELSLYLDGASLGTTTSTGTFQPFGDWLYDTVIGARNNRGIVDGFFTGLIDELKVYNYALTADDVAVAYEGYTGLDTCVYPPALDFTGPGPNDSDADGVFDKDCVVDIYDFAYFASSWLECGLVPECL